MRVILDAVTINHRLERDTIIVAMERTKTRRNIISLSVGDIVEVSMSTEDFKEAVRRVMDDSMP